MPQCEIIVVEKFTALSLMLMNGRLWEFDKPRRMLPNGTETSPPHPHTPTPAPTWCPTALSTNAPIARRARCETLLWRVSGLLRGFNCFGYVGNFACGLSLVCIRVQPFDHSTSRHPLPYHKWIAGQLQLLHLICGTTWWLTIIWQQFVRPTDCQLQLWINCG